jgi:hypothetical protein
MKTIIYKKASSYFLILNGKVDVIKDEKVVATLGRGDYFGE